MGGSTCTFKSFFKYKLSVHGKWEGIDITQNRREIEQTKYKCTGRLMLYIYLIYICVTNTLYTSEGVRTMIYKKIDKCLNKRLYQYILKIPNKLIAQSIQITVDKYEC